MKRESVPASCDTMGWATSTTNLALPIGNRSSRRYQGRSAKTNPGHNKPIAAPIEQLLLLCYAQSDQRFSSTKEATQAAVSLRKRGI
jgi:hypothetical protein